MTLLSKETMMNAQLSQYDAHKYWGGYRFFMQLRQNLMKSTAIL